MPRQAAILSPSLHPLLLPLLAAITTLGALAISFAGARSPTPPTPTPTPTTGDDTTPLVFVFQKQADPTNIKAKADELAEILAQRLGRPVRAVVPSDYAASVQALVSRRADIAYVSVIPFLLAQRDGQASLLLAEERPDAAGVPRTNYDAVLVVPTASPLKTFDDLKARAKQVRLCFTSTTSTSGYVFPAADLLDTGVIKPGQPTRDAFGAVAFAGSYTLALRQVLDNRADVAAVSAYTVEGSTADVYLKSDERARLRVLHRIPRVPTHVITARAGLDPDLAARIAAELRALAQQRPELVRAVYGATAFRSVDTDEHTRPARDALSRLGLPIESFAK